MKNTSISAMALMLLSTQVLAQGSPGSDFNGDGFDDLAISIPGKNIAGQPDAGAVVTISGGPEGLRHDPSHGVFHRGGGGIPGDAVAHERLGSVLVSADFNGDGFYDLAIGSPLSGLNRGTVVVLYGGDDGLGASAQEIGPSASTDHVNFASALAAADFDGNGIADLAVGVSGAFGDEGALQIMSGSPDGLVFRRIIRRGSLPDFLGLVGSDMIGAALAGGDYNGDGFGDLAVGAPGFDKEGLSNAGEGRVYYIFGTSSGLSVDAVQAFTQDTSLVLDQAENGDRFPTFLVAGDFDGNGISDSAIGVPRESFEDIPAERGGAVAIFYGFTGLTTQNNQFWHQNSPNVPGVIEANDGFGSQLAAGDFDGDGRSELVIGVPSEEFGGQPGAGVVHILRGTDSRLSAAGEIMLHQDTDALSGFFDGLAPDDLLGAGLGIGDFNGDGRDDLAIGVPRKDFRGSRNTGAVFVIPGTSRGLEGAPAAVWVQEDIVGGNLDSEAGDHFGLSLSGGSADCSVFTLCATLSLSD